MQGNGQRAAAAGKGHEDRLDGLAAADGGLQAAAVPMLPAMEVAEEPEKAPGGQSKDPNTYKVLSLVRTGRGGGRGQAGGLGRRSPPRRRAGVCPRGAEDARTSPAAGEEPWEPPRAVMRCWSGGGARRWRGARSPLLG